MSINFGANYLFHPVIDFLLTLCRLTYSRWVWVSRSIWKRLTRPILCWVWTRTELGKTQLYLLPSIHSEQQASGRTDTSRSPVILYTKPVMQSYKFWYWVEVSRKGGGNWHVICDKTRLMSKVFSLERLYTLYKVFGSSRTHVAWTNVTITIGI